MRRRAIFCAWACAFAFVLCGADVPVWNEAQSGFFRMTAAERREKFTNSQWRASLAFYSHGGRWRAAATGEWSRIVRLDGVPNMRDFGGLKTKNGMEFRKGLLYRSAGFNSNAPHRMVTNEAGKVSRQYYGRGKERMDARTREYAVKTLGIRTDLDLRTDGECNGMTGSPLGPEVKWAHVPSASYSGMFGESGKAAFRKGFALLLDERNYPLAFHCIAGADRTGSLAYVIEALCGVSDEDMLFDWELTALSSSVLQFSHEKRYDRLVAGFMRYPGGCARERVEAYVREQGFTDTDMAHLRRLLLVPVQGAAARSETGPTANPDDQFRFFWYLGEEQYEESRDAGLNMLINACHDSHWWWAGAEQRRKHDADNAKFAFIRRMAADGVDHVEKITLNARATAGGKYAQRRKDGGANMRSADLANPEFRAVAEALVAEAAESLKGVPGVVGVHTSSEVRDGSRPSFSEFYRAKCRKELGYDMPEWIEGSQVSLAMLPDLPASGVVDEGYRPLEYLAWFWRRGDGWNDYQDRCAAIFRERLGVRLFSLYDPITRAPPLWDSGGGVSAGNQWYYACPAPFGISFIVSEELAMARGTPGRMTFAIPSALLNRKWATPESSKPESPPEWLARSDARARYITMPPDLIREAIWTLFSRKIDGIGLYPCYALFPGVGGNAPCTNPGTFDAVRDAFLRVGVKLGPLLRAVPERAPEVALLESYASCLLAGAGEMGWGDAYGDMAVAANLSPHVLYEEEISRDGVPASVKVLMLPRTPLLTKGAFEAVAEFLRRGGVVAAVASCAAAVLPDVEIDEYPMARSERVCNAAKDGNVLRDAARRLKASIAHATRPHADSDNPEILVHARTYRGADYVFAVNDRRGFGDYVGPWRKLNEKGLPNSGVVKVRRAAGAVYDLEKHAPAQFKVVGGTTEIPVSYMTTDGRIFLLAPRPLGALSVAVEGGEVVVKSTDRDVMIPIEVACDGGKPRYGVVEDGMWKRPYKAGRNLRVRNLADGRTVSR